METVRENTPVRRGVLEEAEQALALCGSAVHFQSEVTKRRARPRATTLPTSGTQTEKRSASPRRCPRGKVRERQEVQRRHELRAQGQGTSQQLESPQDTVSLHLRSLRKSFAIRCLAVQEWQGHAFVFALSFGLDMPNCVLHGFFFGVASCMQFVPPVGLAARKCSNKS